jgi:tripartite-type tricarboxylate transporter receptor subunit TctC
MGSARRLACAVVGACLFGALLASSAAAAEDADFYAGKSLTIIAGFPPGGGVDGEMRVLARYFANYIPGRPTIVARNMPGAGGVVLGNHLYNVAAADGLTIGFPGRSGFLLSKVVAQKQFNYDLAKFSYIGGAGSTVNALWLSSRTGVASIADLKAARKEIVIGALTPRSENAIVPRVLALHEHWPLRVVTGYAGFNDILIAVERGEVDGFFSHEGSAQNTRPDLIRSGALRPIVQSFANFPDVPVLSDVVADADARALLDLVTLPATIGLPLLGPPGIPAERLDILRRSYMQLMQDQDYRAEADRRGLPVGRAVGGAELQQIVLRGLTAIPEPVLKEYQAYTGLKSED